MKDPRGDSAWSYHHISPRVCCPQLIFGNNPSSSKVTSYFTHVQYHQQAPSFADEIKIELPVVLTPRHHLLFIFSHVTCRNKKSAAENEVEVSTPASIGSER